MAFIDTNRLYTGLQTLIGWKDFYNATDIPPLGLETTESGEYYNTDYLPFDLDVIKAAIRADRDLSEFLNTCTKSGVVYLANKLKNAKFLKKATKGQLQNFTLFPQGGWQRNTIQNKSNFVGLAFKLKHETGLKVLLNKIGIQFTQAQTDLNLYLFHSSQLDPIATITFNTSNGLSWVWNTTDNQTLYADDDALTGGEYFLGYYQDDITGNAIQFKNGYFDYQKGYCGSCGYAQQAKHYKTLQRYMSISAFSVKSGDFTVGEMFDTQDVIYEDSTNYGLNVGVNIECDITNYLVRNRSQLTTALGNAVSYTVMKKAIEYSQQNNFVTDDLVGSIQEELNSDNESVDSVNKKLTDSINSLVLDQSDLGSVCLPCHKPGAVRYGFA